MIVAFAAPVLAQPGGWGPPPGAYGPFGYGPPIARPDPREGRVEAARFVANSPNIAALGHGPITIASAPGSMSAGLEDASFESAVVDQLVKAGYQTAAGANANGQVAEFVVTHDLVQPEEPPHSPVSGQVDVELGNRGSAVGLGIAVDMSKALKALIATRLEARIRDKATHELLWEGHADVVTREGDKHWSAQLIATRLAAALFKNFPKPS
jgi:hypothetical protein